MLDVLPRGENAPESVENLIGVPLDNQRRNPTRAYYRLPEYTKQVFLGGTDVPYSGEHVVREG